VIQGNFQILPRPTAEPVAANINVQRLFQVTFAVVIAELSVWKWAKYTWIDCSGYLVDAQDVDFVLLLLISIFCQEDM
jgi:hypothetical protein